MPDAAGAMMTLSGSAEQAASVLDGLSRHSPEHRADQPRPPYCLAETDVRRCTHGDCCAAATAEDFLCDYCRAGCSDHA